MNVRDWQSPAHEALINPRVPLEERTRLERQRSETIPPSLTEGHFFVLTSGTTAGASGRFKWVALAKRAVLASAQAANSHLRSGPDDVWWHGLPEFHVGGLGIWARAYLSGARVLRSKSERWDPHAFVSEVGEATLCSLVPTQVFDLVRLGLKSPSSLRAILVGGGSLSPALYREARRLGWNVLPTYGMTEACSQVATATLESLQDSEAEYPSLNLLDHWEAQIDEDGRIRLRGPALLTGYVIGEGDSARWVDPKSEGWFRTEDLGEIAGRKLVFRGRIGDRIKIGGELSDLARLRAILEEEIAAMRLEVDAAIVAAPDPRLESFVQLLVADSATPMRVEALAARFNRRVLPFERIRAVVAMPQIPRTELGKLKFP